MVSSSRLHRVALAEKDLHQTAQPGVLVVPVGKQDFLLGSLLGWGHCDALKSGGLLWLDCAVRWTCWLSSTFKQGHWGGSLIWWGSWQCSWVGWCHWSDFMIGHDYGLISVIILGWVGSQAVLLDQVELLAGLHAEAGSQAGLWDHKGTQVMYAIKQGHRLCSEVGQSLRLGFVIR